MKPINESDIKRQQVLFSLSLLSLVLAAGLFTSAFFWSSNSEIEWTSNLQDEQAQLKESVHQIKHLMDRINDMSQKYEVSDGVSKKNLETDLKVSIDSLVTVTAMPDNLNFLTAEFRALNESMKLSKSLLENYTDIKTELNQFKNEMGEMSSIKAENSSLERDLNNCRDELNLCKYGSK